mgnify:CR=1 FL=1
MILIIILNTFSKLETLKKECNAIIPTHYYQDPNIQDAADFMADILVLALQKTKTNVEKIISRFQESIIITSYADHKRYLLRKFNK